MAQRAASKLYICFDRKTIIIIKKTPPFSFFPQSLPSCTSVCVWASHLTRVEPTLLWSPAGTRAAAPSLTGCRTLQHGKVNTSKYWASQQHCVPTNTKPNRSHAVFKTNLKLCLFSVQHHLTLIILKKKGFIKAPRIQVKKKHWEK